MERHGHLQLAPEVLMGLLTMSAATMDRALRDARGTMQERPRRWSLPSTPIRRSVAVRTFSDWDVPPPGFMEADLLAHSGPTAKGSYVQTLTDVATGGGWTECALALVREQKLLMAALREVRTLLPLALLGFDSLLTAWRTLVGYELIQFHRHADVPYGGDEPLFSGMTAAAVSSSARR